MRIAFVVSSITAGLMAASGCQDNADSGSLTQLDGAGADIVSRPDADADVADDTDTTAPEVTDTREEADTPEVEVLPVECHEDADCTTVRPCHAGHCNAGACSFDPVPDGTGCDDGDPCSAGDACAAGACVAGEPLTCDDGDACTEDRCTEGQGCEHVARSCDDGNACTTDACQPDVGCTSTAVACPAASSACETSRCDEEAGCVIEPLAEGAPCDDGDACSEAQCKGGECVATSGGCDDGNACTSDVCQLGEGCVGVPIAGCANEEECVGRVAGASCDDGDPATTADMCLLGYCRGYALVRIAGTLVPQREGLVIRAIDETPDGWSAVFWSVDALFHQSHLLADVTNPAGPTLHLETMQSEVFTGLGDGLAGDTAGRVWVLDGGVWSDAGEWDAALDASGRGRIAGIYSMFEVSAAGTRGARHLWLVGDEHGPWLRHCHETQQGIDCDAQTLAGNTNDAVPVAVAGVSSCNAQVCNAASLAVGADAWAGGGYSYTDAFENATGAQPSWTAGRVSPIAAVRATRAVAGWRSGADTRFIVVGDNGYLLVRRADGSWSSPLSLRDGQTSRDLSGVWVGAGVVVVSAHRLGSNNQLVMELWVAPVDSDLESGQSWVVHELGRYDNADAAGLYDVDGRGDGEVRAVGAVRRAGDFRAFLDGALWVRTP